MTERVAARTDSGTPGTWLRSWLRAYVITRNQMSIYTSYLALATPLVKRDSVLFGHECV